MEHRGHLVEYYTRGQGRVEGFVINEDSKRMSKAPTRNSHYIVFRDADEKYPFYLSLSGKSRGGQLMVRSV